MIGTLIFGAVFERHPQLRIVCVEADAGWAPHWMYRADHAYGRHRNWLTAGELSRRPERLVPRARVPDVPGRLGRVRVADLMNVDHLMWANDFPHSDATWPNRQAIQAEHTAHLNDGKRARILHDNAAELYGIGR